MVKSRVDTGPELASQITENKTAVLNQHDVLAVKPASLSSVAAILPLCASITVSNHWLHSRLTS